ncbi:hypothetical protein ACJ41O_000350 [Fusarium nematophilum]
MTTPHVIIVTGAAGGIGNAIVCKLIDDHGVAVVATDIVEGSLTAQKEIYGEKLQVVTGDIVDLHYAIPELRKTKGTVVAATSGAGAAPLFAGWGFYGMSKAAIAFIIMQLGLEEREVTAVGISPGLCDTKMIADLRSGKQEGWTAKDIQDYEDFVSKIPLVTPQVAAHSYAQVLIHKSPALSGLVLDYDDPRLPIEDRFKRKLSEGAVNYTEFSSQTNS